MSRSTRVLLLATYLALIIIFTGPVLLREMQSRPLTQIVPQGVSTLLMAVNLLPVLLLEVTGLGPANEQLLVLHLPLLMGVQLWSLLVVALRPAVIASPVGRSWVIAYSALWVGIVLLVWLYFAYFWSGG